MSLQTRLSALITAIGADIKELKAKKPIPFSMGPILGNDGSIAQANWVVLPGFEYQFTTPNWPTRCRVNVSTRVSTALAAWNYAIIGLVVTPAPTGRLRGNAVGAVTASQREVLALGFVNSAGPTGIILDGFDEMDLAANTLYTFQVVAKTGGAANSVTWASTAQLSNLMSFILTPT